MIDLIKYFVNDRESFMSNVQKSAKIDLRGRVNFKTGEVMEYPKTGYLDDMFIEITENQASVKGSIHKYFNNNKSYGSQNFNDFSYCDFKHALSNLQNEFLINLKETCVTNLEFGLNIEIKQDPKKLIDKCILMYDYNLPNRNEKFYGKGDFIEFKKTDYSLKIYNKSKQYKLSNRNILRVELKITKSRYLKKHFGIYSVNDLDIKRYNLLFKKLLEHFDKLLIVDSLDLLESASLEDDVVFKLGINPFHWVGLIGNSKRKIRFKRKFEKLLSNYKMIKTKTDLTLLLEDKFNQLVNCDCDVLKSIA